MVLAVKLPADKVTLVTARGNAEANFFEIFVEYMQGCFDLE